VRNLELVQNVGVPITVLWIIGIVVGWRHLPDSFLEGSSESILNDKGIAILLAIFSTLTFMSAVAAVTKLATRSYDPNAKWRKENGNRSI